MLLASCDSGTTNEQTATETTSGTTEAASADTALTDDKRELMEFAAQNNLLQVELGKLAIDQGTSDAVKTYGRNLVDWYTTKQKELSELAQQHNVSLPQQINDEGTKHLSELREAENFNEEYWEQLTDAQKSAIDEFDSKVKDIEQSDATAFSAWARNTLKELQAQYEQARGREVELKRRDSGIQP